MNRTWLLFSCLLAALLPHSSAQLSPVERYLYAQLEDALVNDAATLEQLREVFIREPPLPNEIEFNITITYDFNPASYCRTCLPRGTCKPALKSTTKTASDNTTLTWMSPVPDKDAFDLVHVLTNAVTFWCTHRVSLVFHDLFHLQPEDSYYGFDSLGLLGVG